MALQWQHLPVTHPSETKTRQISVSYRLVWSKYWVPGQPRWHSEAQTQVNEFISKIADVVQLVEFRKHWITKYQLWLFVFPSTGELEMKQTKIFAHPPFHCNLRTVWLNNSMLKNSKHAGEYERRVLVRKGKMGEEQWGICVEQGGSTKASPLLHAPLPTLWMCSVYD